MPRQIAFWQPIKETILRFTHSRLAITRRFAIKRSIVNDMEGDFATSYKLHNIVPNCNIFERSQNIHSKKSNLFGKVQ